MHGPPPLAGAAGNPRVDRPRCDELFDCMCQYFTGGVFDVGLDDGESTPAAVDRRTLANGNLHHVGHPVERLEAGAVSDCGGGHGWNGTKPGAQRADERSTSGSGEVLVNVSSGGGNVACGEQRHHQRRRHGFESAGGKRQACSLGERCGFDVVDVEQFQRCARGNDGDNRTEVARFLEGQLLTASKMALCFGKRREHLHAAGGDPVRERGLLEQPDNVGVGANDCSVVGCEDEHVRGTQPGTLHRFERQIPPRQWQRVEHVFNVVV